MRLYLVPLFCTSAAFAASDLHAQDASRQAGPMARADFSVRAMLAAPEAMAPMAGGGMHATPLGYYACDPGNAAEQCYDLTIGYRQGEIYNPSTQTNDRVWLRGYSGPVSGGAALTAPEIHLKPGTTLRMTLRNTLDKVPPELGIPPCDGAHSDPNEPSCANFNRTNMHTHGLWINPNGNGDNVLLNIEPGVDFQYEFNIPRDHPAGTFWYHPHLHGSTAPQVSSGMTGALIIEGDRKPVAAADGGWASPGDVDVLLAPPGGGHGAGITDRVLMFQQISYACRDADWQIKKDPDGRWICDAGDYGTVEAGPPGQVFDQFGVTPQGTAWDLSGRFTAINGAVWPVLTEQAVAGRMERWRLIHAGVRDTIRLQVRRATADSYATLRAAELAVTSERHMRDTLNAVCAPPAGDADPAPVIHSLATDGLTRPALQRQDETWLQPGYREDLLVTFQEPGIYCLINGEAARSDVVANGRHGPELLGYVEVLPGGGANGDIADTLVKRARAHFKGEVRDRIIADLEDGLKLTAFVRHAPVTDEEVTKDGQLQLQTTGFRIFNSTPVQGPPAFKFEVGEIGQDFAGNLIMQNSDSYDPARIDKLLPLDAAQEWWTTSFGGGGHPFHIHVNPFEIQDIRLMAPPAGCGTQLTAGSDTPVPMTDPDTRPGCQVVPTDRSTWLDVSAPGSRVASGPLPTDGTGGTVLSQYAGLKSVWKDTIFSNQNYLVRFRTRYQRYIGQFVLHCHILDHEDEGMMQNVVIGLPDASGKALPFSHDHGASP